MVLSRSEKEQRIIELYADGRTIREIAREVHMSFSPISAVIRKASGESNCDDNSKPSRPKETEVLKLFEKGKTPVEVAITGIDMSETENLYLGYLRLKNLYHLVSIYNELKNQLPSFVRFFKLLRSGGIREEEAVELIKDIKQIPIKRNAFIDLTNGNANLEEQRKEMLSELSSIKNEIDRQEGYLQWYIEERKRIIFEIEQRKRELQYLNRL